MAMQNQYESWALLATLLGGYGGGLAWLVIVAWMLNSPLFSLSVVLLAGVGIWVSWRAYLRQPQHKLRIVGLSVLWVVGLNLVFANVLYDVIPATLNGISTGKEQFTRWGLNMFLGMMLLPGCYLIALDYFLSSYANKRG